MSHSPSLKIINNFINSLDNKIYNRIRSSKGNAECRRYLKEHLNNYIDKIDDKCSCVFRNYMNPYYDLESDTFKCQECDKEF